MARNSFKELQEENEAKFEESSEEVKRVVKGRRDIWTLIGDLFELYIPQLLSSIVGGEKRSDVSSGIQNDNSTIQ